MIVNGLHISIRQFFALWICYADLVPNRFSFNQGSLLETPSVRSFLLRSVGRDVSSRREQRSATIRWAAGTYAIHNCSGLNLMANRTTVMKKVFCMII